MLRCANNDRPVAGQLQRSGIAEQPTAGHLLDEILEFKPNRIEKLLHHVAPREEGDHERGVDGQSFAPGKGRLRAARRRPVQQIADGRHGRRQRVENLAAATSKAGKRDVVKESRDGVDECGAAFRRPVEKRCEFRIPVSPPDVPPFTASTRSHAGNRLHDAEIRIVPIGLGCGDENMSARPHHPQRLLRGAAVVLDMLKHVEQGHDIETVVCERQGTGIAANEGRSRPGG